MTYKKDGLFVDKNGSKFWYLGGELHREDGPAIVYNGCTGCTGSVWMLNGKKHRDNGEPAVVLSENLMSWYVHGELHREDGPAVVRPVKEDADEWWLHGTRIKPSDGFNNMVDFIEELNTNEDYSLRQISDFCGIIAFIKNPTGKQTRLHAMRWKI